jgi:hypothetical protein
LKKAWRISFEDLREQGVIPLPNGGFIKLLEFVDFKGSKLSIIKINNGLLTLSVLPDRGMEIG